MCINKQKTQEAVFTNGNNAAVCTIFYWTKCTLKSKWMLMVQGHLQKLHRKTKAISVLSLQTAPQSSHPLRPPASPPHENQTLQHAMPSYRSLQVVAPSNDFRQATRIVEIPQVPAPSVGHVIVKNHYVGINATDINIVNGGYGDVSTAGCEGVGLVHAVGDGVSSVQVGDAVAYQSAYSFRPSSRPGMNAPRRPALTQTDCGTTAMLAVQRLVRSPSMSRCRPDHSSRSPRCHPKLCRSLCAASLRQWH